MHLLQRLGLGRLLQILRCYAPTQTPEHCAIATNIAVLCTLANAWAFYDCYKYCGAMHLRQCLGILRLLQILRCYTSIPTLGHCVMLQILRCYAPSPRLGIIRLLQILRCYAPSPTLGHCTIATNITVLCTFSKAWALCNATNIAVLCTCTKAWALCNATNIAVLCTFTNAWALYDCYKYYGAMYLHPRLGIVLCTCTRLLQI
jgi:hypothetical protein